jgi:hypothetical protein
MVAAGRLAASGKARAARYSAPAATFHRGYRGEGLKEDEVWAEARAAIPVIDSAQYRNARTALGYDFTEMLNNAIDHSRSADIDIDLTIPNIG